MKKIEELNVAVAENENLEEMIEEISTREEFKYVKQCVDISVEFRPY